MLQILFFCWLLLRACGQVTFFYFFNFVIMLLIFDRDLATKIVRQLPLIRHNM